MRILLVCMGYDYGQPSRGRSYEYFNFYDSLKADYAVTMFDFMEEIAATDRITMNQRLLQKVYEGDYDVVVFSLYTDQFDLATIDKIRKITKTLCFFHDDTWRREFVHTWAPHFDFFTSSDPECKNKYARLGLPNVIHFPFGANVRLYKPMGLEKAL